MAGRSPHRRHIVALVLSIGALILLLALPGIAQFVTDWYWFSALGFESVFVTRLTAEIVLGVVVGAVAFAFLYGNLRVAQRGFSPAILHVGGGQAEIDVTKVLRRLSLPIAAGLGLLMGLGAAGSWLTVLRFLKRTSFDEVDPVFGKDIGYYVFTMPVISIALGLAVAMTVMALLGTGGLYVLRRDIVAQRWRVIIEPSAELHLSLLAATLFLATAVNLFFLRIPSLVYSTTGPLFGASYADLAIRAPLFRVLGIIAVLGAVLVLLGVRQRALVRNAAIAIGTYVVVAIGGLTVAAAMQKFVVLPNELNKESPQLAYHVTATRRAWGLDDVEVRDLSGNATLTLEDIQNNSGTLQNVRLWDRAPLLQTFRQLQEIRTYYDFAAVDDDRYWIDGQYRQVLLSPRELNSASLPTRTFINERLTFTHGMGLTLSPVNQVTPEGLPELFIKDLPPTSSISVKVTRPQVYFGELSNDFVFVNTNNPEFDYPAGDTNAVTVYQGTGGVRMSSLLRRILLSIRFRSTNVLMTDEITRDSRVLYHRRISERASKALPFLTWDQDPYIVVTENGQLKWILDAYTTTTRYPFSAPAAGGVNYMRNSVKVIIDAYDGDVRAYITDPDDPIIQTYAKLFPDIFIDLDEMPADMRAHIRYPSDLFSLQTALYTTYHMDEPDVFYAREDQWQIPRSSENTQDAFLQHIVMKLPGEAVVEYITMTPFTPRQKDNLAAWMVARSDGDHYGQLLVYRFPRQSLVFGPAQIVNRINQDTEISQQVSLWDQRGSEVIRGNLLVIPIETSLLFVQALYLRAEGGRIPELKRVIVAHQNQVVMEETLGAALTRLFGGSGFAPRPAITAVAATDTVDDPVPVTSDDRVADVARSIADHYDAAIAAQRVGDWATYGVEMRLVGELVQQLRNIVGS